MGRDALTKEHLFKKYNEVRRKWLKSEQNTDFDNELADFFDEFEDYFSFPMGN